MLAGTKDGEGVGEQGVTCENIGKTLPEFVCELTTTPCQGAKPIAVQTGAMSPPWTPNILPLQIVKIGNLFIVAEPVEVTTMSGRRIRETVANHLPKTQIIILFYRHFLMLMQGILPPIKNIKCNVMKLLPPILVHGN